MRTKDQLDNNRDNQTMRLNKYLSDAGVCSRREADRLIEAGKISINGITAIMGQKVSSEDKVEFEGRLIKREEELVIIALNKPVGIECTADSTNPDNIVDYVNYPIRIYPVGRLDKNSRGLILLTNGGEIVNKILKASMYHEKEYEVRVNKKITKAFIEGMSGGVPILDTVTRPCKVVRTGDNTFKIILTQGLNRQIRRMCQYFGYEVVDLKRIRIMNIKVDGIKEGTYRQLSDIEFEQLKRDIL